MERRSGTRAALATPPALAVAIALLIAASAAHAQDPADLPPPAGDQPGSIGSINVLGKRPYWGSSAGARAFLAATLEAGIIYYRPTLAVGYGRPHWSWIGIEGYTSLSVSSGSDYLGIRAALPNFEIRGGARYAFSFSQYFLEPKSRYSREDTELKQGPQSRYVAAELELSGSVPLPGGRLFGVATGYAVLGTPEDYYLYEEALHTVMKPPFLYRARLGYLGDVDRYAEFRMGGGLELMGNPARDSTIVRAGPVLSLSLTHHLDVVGSIMVVLATPDTLGILGADLGQLGLRYRWATGDAWPEFP